MSTPTVRFRLRRPSAISQAAANLNIWMTTTEVAEKLGVEVGDYGRFHSGIVFYVQRGLAQLPVGRMETNDSFSLFRRGDDIFTHAVSRAEQFAERVLV